MVVVTSEEESESESEVERTVYDSLSSGLHRLCDVQPTPIAIEFSEAI